VVREAFELVVAGQPAGVLSSENWFDLRFLVLDAEGAAYAQVNKVHEGYARARFTSPDRYTVRSAVTTSPVQRAMALTAAVAMGIASTSTEPAATPRCPAPVGVVVVADEWHAGRAVC
jgi:hypothetical protein